jgi:hypothetical protein
MGEEMTKKKKEKGTDLGLWIFLGLIALLILKGLGLLKLWFNIDPDGISINFDVGYLLTAGSFLWVLSRLFNQNKTLTTVETTMTNVSERLEKVEKRLEEQNRILTNLKATLKAHFPAKLRDLDP